MACAERREEDPQLVPEHAYCYTNLLDLKKIIFANQQKGKKTTRPRGWSLFKDRVPKYVADNKQEIEESFSLLNAIRNRVMHPVRGNPPGEEEFKFVKRMYDIWYPSKWRKVQSGKAKS
jgi:hypothetical protein